MSRRRRSRGALPLLAIFGELDPLLPALESVATYRKALRAAGNRDATIVVFPQGNHRIRVAETGICSRLSRSARGLDGEARRAVTNFGAAGFSLPH